MDQIETCKILGLDRVMWRQCFLRRENLEPGSLFKSKKLTIKDRDEAILFPLDRLSQMAMEAKMLNICKAKYIEFR